MSLIFVEGGQDFLTLEAEGHEGVSGLRLSADSDSAKKFAASLQNYYPQPLWLGLICKCSSTQGVTL